MGIASFPQAGTSPYPTFRVDRTKRCTNGLAFCVAPISPRAGALPHSGTVTNTASGAITYNPTWFLYKGVWILGQKMSTAQATSVGLGIGPVTSSSGDFLGDYSTLVLGDMPSTATLGRVLVQGNFGISAPHFVVNSNYDAAVPGVSAGKITFYNSSNGTSITGYVVSTAGQLDGAPHCWVCRRKSGVYTLYRDGVNVTGATVNDTGAMGTATGAVGIGELPGGNEGNAPNCTIALTAGWNRSLSDSEMAELSADPFQLFIEPSNHAYQLLLAWPPLKLTPPIVTDADTLFSPSEAGGRAIIYREPLYGSSVAFTTTNLQSLTSDATGLHCWASAVVDNTSNLYTDEIITWVFKAGTTPTTNLVIECWLYEALDDAPTYPDVITGSEGTFGLTSLNVKSAGGFKFAGLVLVDTTTNRLYYNTVRLSQIFGDSIPKKWGAMVMNGSGATLASSGNVVTHTPVQYRDA